MSFKNLPAFKKRLNKRLTTKAHGNAKAAVTRATLLVEGTAKQSIMAGGTGKTYEKYKPRRTHTASAAGQPPASDEGYLASHITMNVSTKTDGSVVGQIISAAPYSKALEFGTVNMQPRPFMHPALMKNKNKIVEIFKKEGIIR